ncbi:hypothetical protein Ccrd_018646 [Cynara cardunculus var. scolymus]|uniref:Uncharacterized protein n=1 Tax=Cynara cardunculus var. scolymus TaxID=59895 RepID=A0A118K1L4_CYNCS|nr:hypothetical protein Ccrd_018646 [Cynara cardunculus var. scolymus]
MDRNIVKKIMGEHVIMTDVQNPNFIDQNYCSGSINCSGSVFMHENEQHVVPRRTQSIFYKNDGEI